jgi:hypothetical protein
MKVIHGTATDRRPSPLEDAYLHFRLDRQGLPVSPRTLGFYDEKVGASTRPIPPRASAKARSRAPIWRQPLSATSTPSGC